MKLHLGLYEQLVSHAVDGDISDARSQSLQVFTRQLDEGDSYGYFAQYLASQISRAFKSFPAETRLERQVDLANQVIDLIAAQTPDSFGNNQAKVMRAELLLAILQRPVDRPDTPLSASCLMTGTRQDPSLVSQLQKEIASADRVDIDRKSVV